MGYKVSFGPAPLPLPDWLLARRDSLMTPGIWDSATRKEAKLVESSLTVAATNRENEPTYRKREPSVAALALSDV
jgi:hypothetical protein